ncbi:MAG: DUF192 domain-containing protein [Bryobacterales bacterium]
MNAASFLAPPVAGSGLAQGSLISIFGAELGPEPGVSAEQFPLAMELAGVSVDIQTSDGRVLAAIPLFVSAGQINALLPSETPVGLNLVAVHRGGVASGLAAVKVVRSSFGLFAFGSGVVRPAAAQRYVSETDHPLATSAAPARPGETVVLWGTGMGPVTEPESNAPQTGSLETPVEVLVGHKSASISYQGRTSCCVGLDQINIRIPDDAPAGCFVPVWVTVHGAQYSNLVTIPISADGGPCVDGPPLPPPLPGAPVGRVLLRRAVELDDSLSAIEETTRDLAVGRFGASPEEPAEAMVFSTAAQGGSTDGVPAPLGTAGLPVLPPAGTCLAYDGLAAETGASLDAGIQLELDGPAGRAAVARVEGEYRLSAPPGTLFLGTGRHHVEGIGGNEFPPFAAEVSSGEPAQWTATAGEEVEARLSGLSLEWALPPAASDSISPEAILVVGRDASAQPPGVDGEIPPTRFVCSAAEGAEALAIPAAVLANLPETTADVEITSVWGPRLLEFATDGPETGSLAAYLHALRSSVRLGQAHLPGTPVGLPDGTEIFAEVAASFGEQQRGLMFRRELPAGQGMLFLFDTPGRYGFWMLSTLVPLDILWLDSERRIVFISANTPPCPAGTACPTYGSDVTAQFVLELAAGQAAARGLRVGDPLDW